MKRISGIVMIAAVLGGAGCGSHDTGPHSTQPMPATSSPHSDPIRDSYLRVQAYVQQHPESAHFFDPQPGQKYQGPNLLQNWATMCDPTGVALNAWQDDYARFSWAVNRQVGHAEFGPISPNGVIIETSQCPHDK